MLLSRFWYLLLSLAVAVAAAAALLSQSVINARTEEHLEEGLKRDRIALDAMLRLEARARLDRIGFISVDSSLASLLRQARDVEDDKRLRELNGSVKQAMQGHVARIVEAAGAKNDADKRAELEPDIAFALDARGRIIAQLGPLEVNPPGASLATFPLVKRALQGYVRDDVWVYDRRVYRMAARPVITTGEFVGAILHGYRFDKGLAKKLAANLGTATVLFFENGNVLTSHVPGLKDARGAAIPQKAELAAAVPKAIADAKFAAGERSELVALDSGGRAIIVPITGEAAGDAVGYAIARPRMLLTSPAQIFDSVSQDDVNALPLPILGGGAVVLTLIGLLFMYLERDRHMKSLETKTAEIVSGDRDRLIVTEWRGAYRALADQINQAIDKRVEGAAAAAPTTRRKADLQEILGHTPEASSTPFFGFADEPGSGTTNALPPASSPGAAPAPAKPKHASGSQPAVLLPVASRAASGPVLPAAPRAASPVPAAPVPAPAAAPAATPAARSLVADTPEEDVHWREVYDQYVTTRKQCGEPVEALTYEKFGVTLRKTRDQLVEKHGANAVRFSVQVKEGKAALKAAPVK